MFGAPLIIAAIAAAPLAVGALTVRPADVLDGRAIAGAGGDPVVLLTLTAAMARRLKAQPASVLVDGKPAQAMIADNTIEITGSTSFEAAVALAKRLSGKDPLPDSLDE